MQPQNMEQFNTILQGMQTENNEAVATQNNERITPSLSGDMSPLQLKFCQTDSTKNNSKFLANKQRPTEDPSWFWDGNERKIKALKAQERKVTTKIVSYFVVFWRRVPKQIWGVVIQLMGHVIQVLQVCLAFINLFHQLLEKDKKKDEAFLHR